jgi:hypothetical protein
VKILLIDGLCFGGTVSEAVTQKDNFFKVSAYPMITVRPKKMIYEGCTKWCRLGFF